MLFAGYGVISGHQLSLSWKSPLDNLLQERQAVKVAGVQELLGDTR